MPHRIALAAIFVLTHLVVDGGVRSVCIVLQLSRLWRVVVTDYSISQKAEELKERTCSPRPPNCYEPPWTPWSPAIT